MVVVLAVTWLLGGFQRSSAYIGRERAIGETIRTRYWDLSVERAGVTGAGGPAFLVVILQATNLTRESQPVVFPGSVAVRLADGGVLAGPRCKPNSSNEGSLDPLVRTETACVFNLAATDVRLPGQGDQPLEVIIFDQRPLDPNSVSDEPEALLPPAAHVRVNARWLVQ